MRVLSIKTFRGGSSGRDRAFRRRIARGSQHSFAGAGQSRQTSHGTFTLLEAARSLKVPRLRSCLDGRSIWKYRRSHEADENYPLRASSPYSASKAGSDLLALSYYTTYNLNVTVTRASNNYGPYQFPEKLIPLMISNALEDKPLPVYGDGQQVRDWLYVEDHCRAIFAVLKKGRPGEVYNVGGNCSLTNLEVVKRILEDDWKARKPDHASDGPARTRPAICSYQ